MPDVHMGNAHPHGNNQAGPRAGPRQNRNQHNRNQITCSFCNRTGHVASACRNNPNNMNGNGNGNRGARNANSGNAGNNADNFNNANGAPGRAATPPESAQAGDQCYIHPRNPHSNAECQKPSNLWSPKNPANQNGQNNGQQQQNQNRQQNRQNQQSPEEQLRASQQAHCADLKSNYTAIPGGDCNYCERCNTVGHLAATCSAPAIDVQAKGIICLLCRNHGHTSTECKHPAFCSNCRTLDCKGLVVTDQSCEEPPHVGKLFIFPDVQPTYKPNANAVPLFPAPQPQKAGFHPPPPAFQVNTPPQSGGHPPLVKIPEILIEGEYHQVYKNNNNNNNNNGPIYSFLTKYAADQAAEKKRAIEAKCQRAHASYGLHMLNDLITETERQLSVVNPTNPHLSLPKGLEPTAEIESLCKSWIHSGAFAIAAAMIRSGFNFFRDPRALDGLHRAQRPVCLTCRKDGMVVDATFHELKPGHVDILTLKDYLQWGVSVVFPCKCCRNHGFTWVGRGEVL